MDPYLREKRHREQEADDLATALLLGGVLLIWFLIGGIALAWC